MVTSLEYIKKIAEGNEVEITGWEEGVPFVCKLKRVSLFGLVSEGAIPNPLLTPVMALFDGKKEDVKNISAKEMADIMEIFCKHTLVEPKYEEVREYLTDIQRSEIFNYSQGGLKMIESFRKNRENLIRNNDGKGLQDKAKRNTKPKK